MDVLAYTLESLTRQIIHTCVMPILLHGAENWVLTDQLGAKLESLERES